MALYKWQDDRKINTRTFQYSKLPFHPASADAAGVLPKGAHNPLASAPAESAGKAISIFRRKLIYRAIELPFIRLYSKRASGKSLLVRTRIKTGQETLRIYHFGNLGLHEMFTRLPDLFLQEECKTIKSEKKIRVVCVPLRIGQTIKSVYVKQHNAVSLKHRLASIFSTSAALRSLYGAATLLQEGYATARPIAAVEHRNRGILIKSFYLSEEISAAKTITNFWREDLLSLKGNEGRVKRRAVLRALARVFEFLHESRIYHNDLKASNILALDGGPGTEVSFSLIDLQGVRKCLYLSKRRKIKNLAQLNRTLGDHLTRTEKLFFITAYGGDQISDPRKKRSLLRSILEETARQIVREKSRHPTAENAHALNDICGGQSWRARMRPLEPR